MPAKRYFMFTSGAEVRAFIQGMNFSNEGLGDSDSLIKIEGTYWVPGKGKRSVVDGTYVVLVIDYCYKKSDPKPKGMEESQQGSLREVTRCNPTQLRRG